MFSKTSLTILSSPFKRVLSHLPSKGSGTQSLTARDVVIPIKSVLDNRIACFGVIELSINWTSLQRPIVDLGPIS